MQHVLTGAGIMNEAEPGRLTGARLFMRGRKQCRACIAGMRSTEPSCTGLPDMTGAVSVTVPLLMQCCSRDSEQG